MVRRHRELGLLVGSILVAGATAQQAGSLRGVVRDKDFDAPLRGAVVQVVELGLKVETNETGNFVFNQVRAGRFTVIASKDGYVRQLRADVVVSAGKLTDLSFELAGDFTDLEEFVVRDSLQLGAGTEQALLDLRAETPALMDSISDDQMSKAAATDAAAALRLVAGASTADGKTAVVRGLPDRYVSSQLNGVLLPSADEDKRAVELDLFPSEVIDSLQVTKTFTPDQQGNASGGAVNVVLKGVPDEPGFLKWKVGTSTNSNVEGSEFLTYRDGGVHSFGKSGSDRSVQPLGENWSGAVGVEPGEAPLAYKAAGAAGGSFDLGNGWRGGGFVNLFFERDASFSKGRDDSLWALSVGEPLTPQFSQGAPQQGQFITSLLDVTQASQSASFGGLGTLGIANTDHAINLIALFTQIAEDTATLAEDTRGKQYFFPGHDPEDPTSPGSNELEGAPYLRLQTLTYTERRTDTLQLNGRHRFDVDGGPLRAAELSWTVARSHAIRDEPDKRQFGSKWLPTGTYRQLQPAAQATLGNVQRIYERITEDSDEARVDLKLPFEAWGSKKGYLKFGGFHDRVERQFRQDTFSNFSDPNSFFQFPGQFDELDWSQVWEFQDHLITASETDVDYDGRQKLVAGYAMLELPLTDWVRAIGGIRVESTDISIVNFPEAQALWIPPGQFGTATLLPGDGDVAFSQQDELPAFALVADPLDGVTLRAAYSETVARQTFRELTPIFQQEYLGGPVFVGNPDLQMSSLRNYDLRADWTPYEGGLFSVSYFRKDVKDPIEYVEKLAFYSFTTAVNYPRGKLDGFEVEARQGLGTLSDSLSGMSIGGNSTWINASVRVPQEEILAFEQLQGVAPPPTRDMTNAPEYLWNLFATWDIEATGTGFGLFYTVTGDTLIQGPGPSNTFFVPSTYETRWANLNASISQALGAHVRITFSAKNLTDEVREQVYRSDFTGPDVTRRTYSEGIEYSLGIGGEVRF